MTHESLEGPSGRSILDSLERAGVEFVAALPDITTSEGLLWPLATDARFRLVRLCKEDEGVSICAGLAYADRRGVLLMQNTGFLDSVNAVRAIAVQMSQPICMLVGLLGKEPDRLPSESDRYSIKIMEPIIRAMGIDYINIEGQEDVAQLAPAVDRAYKLSRPLAVLIGRTVMP